MATNNLENFSLYLWDNPEGYHITVTTNYKLPTEKRSFFSFGKQTYKSWTAYNLHQPEPLRGYFAEFKHKHKSTVKTYASQYWISKLVRNTGTHGRRTAPGAMILLEEQGIWGCVVQFAEHEFRCEFDANLLSHSQKQGAKGQCIGAYIWKDDSAIDDWVEAF